jgi:hypothetical protein
MRIRILGPHVTLSGTPTTVNAATNVRVFHEDPSSSHSVYVSGVTGLGSFRIGQYESIIILKLPEDVIWTDGSSVTATKVGYYGS